MNKRQKKKYMKNRYPIDPISHCINRECCGEDCDGCSYPVKRVFRKLLKKEHISHSGWELSQAPISGVYIFYNHKKHKEITLIFYNSINDYEITVYDPLGCENVHMDSILEALHSRYQNVFYCYHYHIGTRKKKTEIKMRKYKEKRRKSHG